MTRARAAVASPPRVHVVRVLPADAELEVADGEALYWAAQRHGWIWPSVCKGDGDCGQCYLIVEQGQDSLGTMSVHERDRLAEGLVAGDGRARLACMTRVRGSAVVRRKGARPGPRRPGSGRAAGP